MPKSKPAPPAAEPTVALAAWLATQPQLPLEAVAGFRRAMADQPRATPRVWQQRWTHWWTHPA